MLPIESCVTSNTTGTEKAAFAGRSNISLLNDIGRFCDISLINSPLVELNIVDYLNDIYIYIYIYIIELVKYCEGHNNILRFLL